MKKVIFDFCDESYESLNKMAENDNISKAEVIRQALQIRQTLKKLALEGFNLVIVENKNKEQKLIKIP